jgi:hypothetical protein
VCKMFQNNREETENIIYRNYCKETDIDINKDMIPLHQKRVDETVAVLLSFLQQISALIFALISFCRYK